MLEEWLIETKDLCIKVPVIYVKKIISMYPKDVEFTVYCRDCWWSDKWDATDHGRDYDFSRPFFEQLKELFWSVPHLAIWQRNVINSDFSNMVGESKNVYLSASVVMESENVFYSKAIDKSFNIFDCSNLKESNNCYENIEGEKNYNSQHLFLSRSCIDSMFLIDCVNCSNCVLSSNLRNKEFYFRNKQYSKEEYFNQIEKLNLGSRQARNEVIKEFDLLCEDGIYRYANIIKSVDSTGNNILNAKNSKYCFDFYDMENLKYGYRGISVKDSMDFDFGTTSELMYEYSTGATNDYNVRFSYSAMGSVRNAEYTDSCVSSENIFGCYSLKKKEYVILNKVYTKEKFFELREKIIKHMNEMPFKGSNGREYKYGEFFPVEISPFGYNETCAHEFYPLTKEEILKRGHQWRDLEEKIIQLPLG